MALVPLKLHQVTLLCTVFVYEQIGHILSRQNHGDLTFLVLGMHYKHHFPHITEGSMLMLFCLYTMFSTMAEYLMALV